MTHTGHRAGYKKGARQAPSPTHQPPLPRSTHISQPQPLYPNSHPTTHPFQSCLRGASTCGPIPASRRLLQLADLSLLLLLYSAELRDSNQPAPASDPIVNEGGADYDPDGEVNVAKSEPVGEVGQQEVDGLDQDNILADDDRTRGNKVDYAKKEQEADQAVEEASEANDGTSATA